MPKMKHLLRKLHIGGEVRPVNNSAQSPVSSSGAPTSVSSLSSSSSSAATMGRTGAENAVSERTVGMAEESTLDYNLLEEEYQVQLALAMSASDSEQVKREDPESEQIKAAKRMSLGCSPSVAESESFAEFLSLRYWNYNFVNYDEKVMDGFYDVYGITPSSIIQGKMPSLLDLQVISIADSDDYEVILVNRSVDSELQLLEDRAYLISMESQSTETGLGFGGLIQKVACLVVDRLGGPVGDADEMVKRWSIRKSELRSSLNTIIFPLGSLDVGLSRHRALLFKVLADKINLPCMLVKGSYYTGTDEGAVNLIKVDNGSEYIIDLMGAPGTLIPSEVPGNFLPNFDFDRKCFTGAAEFSKDSSIVLGKETLFMDMPHALDRVVKAGGSVSEEASSLCFPKAQTGKASTEKADVWGSESRFGKFLPSIPKSREDSLGIEGIASSAEKKNVKNVSRYVISAAKDPEFAQKLHAVLLESGASPPADLFSGMNFQEKKEQEVHKEKYLVQDMSISSFYQPGKFLLSNDQPVMPSTFAGQQLVELSAHKHNKSGISIMDSELSLLSATTSDGYVLLDSGANAAEQNDTVCDSTLPANLSSMAGGASNGEQALELPLLSVPSICQRNAIALVNEGKLCSNDNIGRIVNNIQKDKKLEARLMETAVPGAPFAFNVHTEKNNPVLSEVAEWEIQWEDLHIGERIGIGSYGEVYRADWNGTEVAVKKFLDQDFSGDALAQFKCEIEIMLRLRHPNIVLFMGAVTRPPNLSILTEYLPRGSLYRLLHRSSLQLDEKRRIRMAIDVAKGMNYLHASHPTIVHRDLKSPNLLVDKNWVVKVCDFGLSRLKHHTFLSSRSTAGTPEWMAPEVLRNEPANEKCDVYSFGVILWELVTLRVPWTGLNPMQVVGAVGFQNRRLKIEQNIDPAVAKIMNDCWQTEPDLRPTFAQLIARLKQVQCLCVPRSVCATQTRE